MKKRFSAGFNNGGCKVQVGSGLQTALKPRTPMAIGAYFVNLFSAGIGVDRRSLVLQTKLNQCHEYVL